jgi:DNA-binding MurR/RpiR family transcriptional regulator
MPTPAHFDELAALIAQRHDHLSDRLRRIADFAMQHPNEMALGTVAVLSERIGVQPSAIIRFANSLGYDGFTGMQQVFRMRLVAPSPPGYRERIDALRETSGDAAVGEPPDILASSVAEDIAALDALYRAVSQDNLERALSLMAAAETIYITAQGRSFPVAYYLDYGLSRLDLRSHLLDSVGGLSQQRARAITDRDALIAISFKPYARDVSALAEETASRRTPVIAITDNRLGALGRLATVVFDIPERRDRPFRSLVAPLTLAQSLVVALGHRLAATKTKEATASVNGKSV